MHPERLGGIYGSAETNFLMVRPSFMGLKRMCFMSFEKEKQFFPLYSGYLSGISKGFTPLCSFLGLVLIKIA